MTGSAGQGSAAKTAPDEPKRVPAPRAKYCGARLPSSGPADGHFVAAVLP